MAFNILASARSIKNCYECMYDSLNFHKFEFTEKGNLRGWDLTSNVCLYGCWSEFLFGHSTDRKCYISREENFIHIEAEHQYIIKLTMRVINRNLDVLKGAGSLTTGRIQWVSIEESIWDDIKQKDFSIVADGKWHIYTLNMGPSTSWVGRINNLRIYPFIDGWEKDSFAISSIGLGGVEKYNCSNTNCSYNQYYSHPCKGAGSFGSITSKENLSEAYTTISGVNDIFSININNYGYENLSLGNNIDLNGIEIAALLNKKISDLGIGSYAYSVVEYINKCIKITSGAIGIDSNIKIAYNNAAVTLGFFNDTGEDISDYEIGSGCVDGYSCMSSAILTVDVLNRMVDGNIKSAAYTHVPSNYSVSSGRLDYYNVVSETMDYRTGDGLKKIAWNNRLNTIIDISHPINTNGKIHNIHISGKVYSDDQAKVFILRPLKNGKYKTIYTFNLKVKDSVQLSREIIFHSVECNVYVQKGDVLGFYNIDLFYSAGKKSTPDAVFFHIDGEISGTFNPGKLSNYGVAGFLYFCFSDTKQTNTIFDVDLGDRINIKNINILGSILNTDNTFNIGICNDIGFLCELYEEQHRHPQVGGAVIHNNKGYGLSALTDGVIVSLDGGVGDQYGVDSDGLWITGESSYFYVNGDEEFSTEEEDSDTMGGYMLDHRSIPEMFENDPVSLFLTWDYGFSIPINKVKIYFKEPYNFRNMELSYYLGAYNASGNATLEPYFNRIPNYNLVTLDNRPIEKDNNVYIYDNPTYAKPIFEYETCINADAVRVVSQTKWFGYECEFDSVDAYGFRIFSDYHKSTKISEIEVYTEFETENTISLCELLNVSCSKYGDLWSTVDFFEVSDGEFTGVISDSPRYVKFEFLAAQSIFQINELGCELDKNIKIEGCKETVLLESSKNLVINKATEFKLKNTYDISLDLDIDINKILKVPNRLLLHNIPDSYENISNSLIGPGGKIYKYNEPHEIKTVYNVCSSGAPIYTLKNLLVGKKYYYNIDNNGWHEGQTISVAGDVSQTIPDTGAINYGKGKNWKKNVLTFDNPVYGKYFEISLYSPSIISEIQLLKAYYINDILPIKNILIGRSDSVIDNRVPLNYNNINYDVEGEVVFHEEFNSTVLSSKWEKNKPHGWMYCGMGEEEKDTFMLIPTTSGLRFNKMSTACHFPNISMDLDYKLKGFELIIKQTPAPYFETYKSDKHVYHRDYVVDISKFHIYLLNSENEILYQYRHDSEVAESYYSHSFKVIGSHSITKSELTTVSRIEIGVDGNSNHYGDRDTFNLAIEEVEAFSPTVLDSPLVYTERALQSVTIKTVKEMDIHTKLYIEFEQEEYLTKLELYGDAFWLGLGDTGITPSTLPIVYVGKSTDGYIYDQLASTNTTDTVCGGFSYLTYKECMLMRLRKTLTNDGIKYVEMLTSVPEGEEKIFNYKRYIDSYPSNQGTYPTTANKEFMYSYRTRDIEFKYDITLGEYISCDFGSNGPYKFDEIEILASNSTYPMLITIYGRNSVDDEYEEVYTISDVLNYSGTTLNYRIIDGLGSTYYNRILITDLPDKGYRCYKFVFGRDSWKIHINHIDFKKNIQLNGGLVLTLEDCIEEIAIDIEKIHNIGWFSNKVFYGTDTSIIWGYNRYANSISNAPFIDIHSDNVFFSSSIVECPDEVMWGSQIDFTDDFSDGIYDDKWEFIRLNNEMLLEEDNKLSVYSYGNNTPNWYGPKITKYFDKTVAIDFIINLMCKAPDISKGRTTIDFKGAYGESILKLSIEIIDDEVTSSIYALEEIIYFDTTSISKSSLNSIRIVREIKPTKIKYFVSNTLIYEVETLVEEKVYSVDIIFEKYENAIVLNEHYIEFVSIVINSISDNVRWVKLLLEHNDINFYGTYIQNLCMYPTTSKVLTSEGEYNCEWEPFLYDITTLMQETSNVARHAIITTNYPDEFNYKAINVVNGDNTGKDGCWEFDILSDGSFPYIEIDLGDTYIIDEIKLYHGRRSADTDYINKITPKGYVPVTMDADGTANFLDGVLDIPIEFQVIECAVPPRSRGGVAVTNKMLLTLHVQITNRDLLPEITIGFCNYGLYRSYDAASSVIAVSNLYINIDTFDEGTNKALAYAYVDFYDIPSAGIGALFITCTNYEDVEYWGVDSIELSSYSLGVDTPSSFSCFQRDGSYVIQGSTTSSGDDFEYLCPTELRTIVECPGSDPFFFIERMGSSINADGEVVKKMFYYKYQYDIKTSGTVHDKVHYYDNVSIRRIKVIFEGWSGDRKTRFNPLSGLYEVFTGSYLREIEVHKYSPVGINEVFDELAYSNKDTAELLFTSDYPIMALNLGKPYNIKEIKPYLPASRYGDFSSNQYDEFSRRTLRWYTDGNDIRFSDYIFDNPSKILFDSKDETQTVYNSDKSSDIIEPLVQGDGTTTESEITYIFEYNFFLEGGVYNISFEAYDITEERKISIWFEGNTNYECIITITGSSLDWIECRGTVGIDTNGYYTILAKQNSNFDEPWGIRNLLINFIQGSNKQWVMFAWKNFFNMVLTPSFTLEYIEIRSIDDLTPTYNSNWWHSIGSVLSTEEYNLKEGKAGIRIELPGNNVLDVIRYRGGDCFTQDKYWSDKDKLTFWLYISDITALKLEECFILYGIENAGVLDQGLIIVDVEEITYYTWQLSNCTLSNGWNKVELYFNDYFMVFPMDPINDFYVNSGIDSLLDFNNKFGLNSFKFIIQCEEQACYMVLDTLKHERTEFLPVKNNNGVYLSGNESLIFNINNLSLKRGTVEFDIKLSSDTIGVNSFGLTNAVTLLSIVTNNNEIITLLITIGKGLNVCIGKIGTMMLLTDTYISNKKNSPMYIGIDQDVTIKIVWSNDGTEMDNSDTFRLYMNNEWVYSVIDKWAITSNSIDSIVFGGTATSFAAVSTDGSGIFSNIKVYNYCKTDNNVIADSIVANDFLEISKDNENFLKLGDKNLPIQYPGIEPGEAITVYVRSNKENDSTINNEMTGNLIASWTLIV